MLLENTPETYLFFEGGHLPLSGGENNADSSAMLTKNTRKHTSFLSEEGHLPLRREKKR